jgi:hypothetical protein
MSSGEDSGFGICTGTACRPAIQERRPTGTSLQGRHLVCCFRVFSAGKFIRQCLKLCASNVYLIEYAFTPRLDMSYLKVKALYLGILRMDPRDLPAGKSNEWSS